MLDPVKLKWLRISHGYTQHELAKMLDTAPSSIGMYEVGQRSPTKAKLERLAKIFHVSPEELTMDVEGKCEISMLVDIMIAQLPKGMQLTYKGRILSKTQVKALYREFGRLCKNLFDK